MIPRTAEPLVPVPVSGEKTLAAIVLLSVALRLFSAFYQGNAVEALPGVHDQVTYHALATRVLNGYGFTFGTDWWPATRAGEPTAHWSYIYTLYLAGVYFVFGANPLVVRLIQSVIVAVLHPWLCWRIGRRLFGQQVGLVAALFVAVYGYFIYYAGTLMTESFFILAILWSMDTATMLGSAEQGERSHSRISWICLGLAVGSAVLLRQVFLLFAPFLMGWLFYALRNRDHYKHHHGAASGILTVCLVMSLMIVPWTVRNYFAFRQFVLLNTNAGFAFFWANHPIHGTDFIPILHDEDATYGTLIPRELRTLDEASLDHELLREGFGFVFRDPQRYFWLCLSRVKEYFRFWPSKNSNPFGNLVRTLSFGLFLPFMVLGVMSALVSRLKGQRTKAFEFSEFPWNGHLLLLLFVVIFTVMHLLSWSLIRYRLPVDGVLILYAAAGALWLVDRLRDARMLLSRAMAR